MGKRGHIIRLRPLLSRSRPRDLGYINFLHFHHRFERSFGFAFIAAHHSLGQDLRRDLPRDAPLVLAPSALTFLAAVPDYGIPIAVGLRLILGRYLKREGFTVRKGRPSIESNAGDAEDSKVYDQNLPFFTRRVVGRSALNTLNATIRNVSQ